MTISQQTKSILDVHIEIKLQKEIVKVYTKVSLGVAVVLKKRYDVGSSIVEHRQILFYSNSLDGFGEVIGLRKVSLVDFEC